MNHVKDHNRDLPWLTVALLMATAAAAASPEVTTVLQYDRVAVGAGEWWRIITCHFTHWSAGHLAWDAAVFAVLGGVAERTDPRRFANCVLGSVVLIPLCVQLLLPGMETYRGLSGVDSALFGLLLTMTMRHAIQTDNRLVAALAVTVLMAFVLKTAVEMMSGATVFVNSAGAFVPVPAAHIAGAAAGVLAGLSGWRRGDYWCAATGTGAALAPSCTAHR